MADHDRIYVNGQWTASSGRGSIDVVNPATEAVLDVVPAGTAEDVDRAVSAAREAFTGWSRTTPDERVKFLRAIAQKLGDRADEIAHLISSEVGSPITFSSQVQAAFPVASFTEAAEILESYSWEETVGHSVIVREPIGVVGAITPWNYPLHQIAAKVAYALAAGNTVVLKPSEVAPLNAYILAEIVDEVGLPAGVFNLVSGTGPIVGEAIAAHPDVDMVSFTGSTTAGRRVSQVAAENIKRVALELGGKSPNVILDGVDLAAAMPRIVRSGLANSGQTCSALTRLVVPAQRLGEVEQLVAEVVDSLVVGDPTDAATDLGPLVSATQQRRVLDHIDEALAAGARLVTGGPEPIEGLETGFYVRPTVFSEVTPEMRVRREEVFGPVLIIETYTDVDEALFIANDTPYGLAAGVWAGDAETARAFASGIRSGQVAINGGRTNIRAPFGGYKQSGTGREYGRHGFEEFLETKSIQM